MAHGMSAQVTQRDINNRATEWRIKCKCRDVYTAATYEAAEDQWREHVWLVTGKAPTAAGNKQNRWQPEVTA